ncbi:dihydrofolate reductase family protein [Paenarthrobacter sp. NPDC089316]|uniref:dihydrofolate reductase family protein n=1 Tax=unclassified Paenarthrobacter TaxID=2634190 RepID=UPI00341BFC22
MSTFQYYVASTIDGFIASPDDDLGWLLQFENVDGVNQGIESFMAGVGSIAMGGDTYRWLMEHAPGDWPYPTIPCWVFTHHEYSAPASSDVTFVRGDVTEFAPDLLKDAGEKNVWLLGGGDLVAQFANAGLLDEIIVTIVPVVLGAGKPLLPLKGPTPPLELVSSRILGGAAAELHYRLPQRPR